MISQLLKVIRESIKAVPAMKYALAVAGILGRRRAGQSFEQRAQAGLTRCEQRTASRSKN